MQLRYLTEVKYTPHIFVNIRDAPIAIFLADSDVRFFGSVTCRYHFLPIPIFFLRPIIDSIHKQLSMHVSTKNILHNK